LNGGQKDSAAITDGSAVTVLNGSHASGLGYVPFDGYVAQLHKGEAVLTASENKAYQMDYSKYGSSDALVSEIKALRNEVSQLRQQQSDETTQMIMANFNANEQAANLVVSGVHESVSTTARREAIKPVLN
jgi:gas vesicle protein